jgi:hypothetical protein
MQNRLAFIDFLKGLLQLNPLERWSPQQARSHPFVTGEKFTGPFTPPARKIPTNLAERSGEGRPRASTISSSQVDKQNVPPQLQRLVALSSSTAAGQRRGAGEPPVDETSDTEEERKVLRGKSVDSHKKHVVLPTNSTDSSGETWPADVEMEDVGVDVSVRIGEMDIQSQGSEDRPNISGVSGMNALQDCVVPRSRRDTEEDLWNEDGETLVLTASHPPGTLNQVFLQEKSNRC